MVEKTNDTGNRNGNKSIFEKYEVWLMAVSILVIGFVVAGLTMYPDQGRALAADLMRLLTHTFGAPMQVLTLVVLFFLIGIAFSKFGEIRLGSGRPEFSTLSWIGMMFFCGQGAGTVYWAFLEWGWHFQAAPQLFGTPVSEAMNYEIAMAYTFFDWGISAWGLLCIFVLPFAYHYHIKGDDELRFSALCKYSLGEKAVKGFFGKVVDFVFIFAAVGAITISAGASASTIATAIADFLGIQYTFAMSVMVLLGVAVLYSITSVLGIEKGMRRISDSNVYFVITLLTFILLVGPTRHILDSVVNALGLYGQNFIRMSLWTDPIARSSYPQDWTVFYLVYWLVFGPFTGLFVAKISKGRRIREVIFNMLLTGSAGLLVFFGIVGGYQQWLREAGLLDVPAMLMAGQAQDIATATLNALPLARIAMLLYLVVIVLFLATTLDATSFTLSSTVSKALAHGEEPRKVLKFVWCLVLVAIPIAIAFIGTDIDTIKAIVLATGFPLVVILAIIYHGFMRELFNDYKHKSKEEIIEEGRLVD